MISYYLGVMGSGKSVRAVERIYNNFSTDKDAKKEKNATFINCVTNIGQFNFDKVENVSELDFDDLLKHLTILHDMHKAKKTDDELLEYLEKINLKNTLFVIDEAQNHFDVDNKILVWWITYHRHLYHEIILITPDLSYINLKYKKVAEAFYVARPRILVLDKRFFHYKLYANYKLSEKSLAKRIKTKSNPKVFELYKSGDSVEGENVILRLLVTASIIAVFLFTIIYFYIDSLTKDEEVDSTKKEIVSTSRKALLTDNKLYEVEEDEDLLNDNEYSKNTYLKLSCSKTKCNDEVISIPPQLLRIFTENKSMIVLYAESINQNLTIYHIDTKTEFYNYIKPKKGSDNEKYNDENSEPSTASLIGIGK